MDANNILEIRNYERSKVKAISFENLQVLLRMKLQMIWSISNHAKENTHNSNNLYKKLRNF